MHALRKLTSIIVWAAVGCVGVWPAGCAKENVERIKDDSAGNVTTASGVVDEVAEAEKTVVVDPTVAETAEASETDQSIDRADEPEVFEESPDVASSSRPDVPTPPSVDTPSRTRLFLPTDGGLLLVDLDIRVDGKALDEVFESRIRSEIRQAGSLEQPDATTWEELIRHVNQHPDRFGNGAMVADAQVSEVIRRYDANQNERAEFDEATKFLYRRSVVAAPFRLAGTDAYRAANRTRAALFRIIDLNGDRVIDDDEAESAADSLIRDDRNDDRRIDINELESPTLDRTSAWDRKRSTRHGDVAMDLEGYIRWSSVSYRLDRFRSMHPFGIDWDVVDQIDADADGTTSPAEASRLTEIPADLTLRVSFGGTDSGGTDSGATDSGPTRPAPRIEPVSLRRELDGVHVSAADTGRLIVQTDSFSLMFRVIESPPGPSDRELWQTQVRARGAEFPDAVFALLDTDHDFILSEREISRSPQRLRELDRSMIDPLQIPDCYLVQLGRGPFGQDDSLFSLGFDASTAETDDAATDWFDSMDANRDGDLSRHEFLGLAEQFERLDVNDDEFIDRSEASSSP